MVNDKHLPMIWGWSVPCLPYVLCLVLCPVSCPVSCTALASACSSEQPLSSLSTGVSWCPARSPAPAWFSTGPFLPMECLADAVPAPGVHTWSVSLRVCSHLLLTMPVAGLAGEQDSSFCPRPPAVTCQPRSLQMFAVSHPRAGTS